MNDHTKLIIDLGLLQQADRSKELEKQLEQVVIALDNATIKGKHVSGMVYWT